jgi:hypothetical protein
MNRIDREISTSPCHVVSAVAFGVLLAATGLGCAADGFEPVDCEDGLCDLPGELEREFEREVVAPVFGLGEGDVETEPRSAFSGVFIYDHTSEAADVESLRIVAEPADEFVSEVEDGHVLVLEVFSSDGSSNRFVRRRALLIFDADDFFGWVTDPIDTSEFMPWQELSVRIHGVLGGRVIDETFTFDGGAIP